VHVCRICERIRDKKAFRGSEDVQAGPAHRQKQPIQHDGESDAVSDRDPTAKEVLELTVQGEGTASLSPTDCETATTNR